MATSPARTPALLNLATQRKFSIPTCWKLSNRISDGSTKNTMRERGGERVGARARVYLYMLVDLSPSPSSRRETLCRYVTFVPSRDLRVVSFSLPARPSASGLVDTSRSKEFYSKKSNSSPPILIKFGIKRHSVLMHFLTKFQLDKSKFAWVRQFWKNSEKIQNLKKFERFNRFWPNLIPKFLDGFNIFVCSFRTIARISHKL